MPEDEDGVVILKFKNPREITHSIKFRIEQRQFWAHRSDRHPWYSTTAQDEPQHYCYLQDGRRGPSVYCAGRHIRGSGFTFDYSLFLYDFNDVFIKSPVFNVEAGALTSDLRWRDTQAEYLTREAIEQNRIERAGLDTNVFFILATYDGQRWRDSERQLV